MTVAAKINIITALLVTAGVVGLLFKVSYDFPKDVKGVDLKGKTYCGVDFAFARSYGSNMVLQKAPVRAKIWGYGFNVGDIVTVSISGGREYHTTTIEGKAGRPVWKLDIDPMEEGGPHTVTATSEGCTISLDNVMFGDVWICAGQSNMAFKLETINDPQPELDDVVNYPDIRTFFTQLRYTDTPQEDVGNSSRSWAVPTKEIIAPYSAVCWLFGKHLYQKYKRPIGLIQSAWGGTKIEAWSSEMALKACYGSHIPKDHGPNAPSVLYNAMIHPLLPMPIYGGIWYQGEANEKNPLFYGCAIKEMVNYWRLNWWTETNTMDRQFPFGEVQLAPNAKDDPSMGFPEVRWHQTHQFGYVPNPQLQRFFMAVAMDLPDFNSPEGSIHPRYKRQVADRLALGAYSVAYGDGSNGTYQGPFPTGFRNNGTNLVITHEGSTLMQRGDPKYYIGYEICCSSDKGLLCPHDDTAWTLTDIVSIAGADVIITMSCAEDQFVTGIRYSWRVSPCDVLEECPVYANASGNNLPAPPFLYNGLIDK